MARLFDGTGVKGAHREIKTPVIPDVVDAGDVVEGLGAVISKHLNLIGN